MDIALQLVNPSPTRAPLLDKEDNSSPPTPTRQIRRKTSFVRKLDSSESCSSRHDSIYEAQYLSTTSSDETSDRAEQMQLLGSKATAGLVSKTENIPTSSTFGAPSEKTEFRYGNGTILDTITEKNSNGTMHSLFYTRSADDLMGLKSIPFLAHKDSVLLTRSPRRKHSFSMDDIKLINRSYHDACVSIDRTTRNSLSIHEIYASPKVPIRKPPERPPTPPGVPSWTAAQNPRPATLPQRWRHIPGTPNRLQRFLGIEPSGITLSSRVQPPEPSRAVSAPSTVSNSRVAPRFRPPRSVYAPLDRHPFVNCPVATVPTARSQNRRVRFTPSATARDSAEINLRTAIESTSGSAVHPLSPMIPIPQLTLKSAMMKSKVCPHRMPLSAPINSTSRTNSISSIAPLMSGTLQQTSVSNSMLIPVRGSRDLANCLSNSTLPSEKEHVKDKKFHGFLPCWKCLLEKGARVWAQTSSCLCFVCCGFECDYESVVYGGGPAGYGFATDSGHFDNHGIDIEGQRRAVLEQTPASMV